MYYKLSVAIHDLKYENSKHILFYEGSYKPRQYLSTWMKQKNYEKKIITAIGVTIIMRTTLNHERNKGVRINNIKYLLKTGNISTLMWKILSKPYLYSPVILFSAARYFFLSFFFFLFFYICNIFALA